MVGHDLSIQGAAGMIKVAVGQIGPLKQTFVKQPVLFDGANFDISRPPPGLGEHTEEVLSSLRPKGAS